MTARTFTIAIVAALIGAVGGFLLANGLNRSEINDLKTKAEKPAAANGQSSTDLDEEEIKAKIKEADASPENFSFQKSLGTALYRYGTMKKDTAIIDEAVRLLDRANKLDPKDYQTTVELGNAKFDTGWFKKDMPAMLRARELYETALAQKPEDADVRSDLALTYYLYEPSDLDRAIAEFQAALKTNPKHERALQYLTETYVKKGNWTEAQKTADRLKQINPGNPALSDLFKQIETKTAATDQMQ